MTYIVPLADLTPAARAVLVNTIDRMGAAIPRGTPREVVAELARHGLIDAYGGLTKVGRIRRVDAMSEALEGL